VAQAFFNGRPANRVRRKWENDRDLMEWEINVYPIADENNQVVRAIVFEQDVTEKRRLEANLVQSEKLAAVGQLAAGIAHEIYNPLTAILANAQMMERELDPEDDRQELVELITKAGTRAAEVVRSLLDMARKEKYVFEPTDINETVQAALKLTNHEMVKRNISLTFDPDPALPFVNASKDHLQVVWVNLLANAMDAMGEGNHEIKIETSLHSNKVQIIFTDTGKGIPSENLPRIFEPFYTNKAAGQGTGLGLSVCHRIIKQHGGAIHVGSQLGKGTQFTIHLPLS
jgi:two-component system NtrC family sensor kinase